MQWKTKTELELHIANNDVTTYTGDSSRSTKAYSLAARNVLINVVCWKHQSINLIKCGSLFIHSVTCGEEHSFGAHRRARYTQTCLVHTDVPGTHRRAWYTQVYACLYWEKRVFVTTLVSPTMQRVAVSGDDLGSQFTAQAGCSVRYPFRIRIYY